MKGDFSRLRFERSKHYTSVLMQQGRVQLDSDANEQRLIDERLRISETFDVVGPDGAPIHAPGFAIGLRPDGASLTIGQGRFYVDGLLCENETPLDFTAQDYLVDPNTQIRVMLDNLRRGGLQSMQVWLEAWQRFVVPLDDSAIKEVALGEADTAARIQTVWRVVVQGIPAFFNIGVLTQNVDTLNQALGNLRLTATANQAATVAPVQANLAATLSALRAQPATTAATAATAISPALADNLRLVHADVASQLSSVNLQSAQGVQVVQATTALGNLIRALPSVDCCEAMRLRQPMLSLPGRLTAQVKSTSDQGPCLPAPNAAYRGLENQLYRIEIHKGGDASTATFKWSRDNGFVVTGVRGESGSTLTVDSLGLDANFGFAPGQWVEISDDSNEFAVPPNQPGALRQIQGTDPARMQVTLYDPAPSVDTINGHAKMRRWDQTTGSEAGIPLSPGGWVDLENGIQVTFSADGIYQSGDYWLIPARTATGDIEWPPADSDGQPAQPAARIVVHRAPLACLHLDQGQFIVEDCRRIFRPLVEIVPPVVPQAMHVQKISWSNDDFISWDQIVSSGLTIGFDQVPSLPVNDANFIVTLELPVWSTFGFTFTTLTAGALQAATMMPVSAETAHVAVASPDVTDTTHISPIASQVTQPVGSFSVAGAATLDKAATASPTLMRAATVLQPGAATISAAAPIAPAAPTVKTNTLNIGAATTVATAAGAELSTPVSHVLTGAAATPAPQTTSPAVAAAGISATSAASQTLNPAVAAGLQVGAATQPAATSTGISPATIASTVNLSGISTVGVQATAPDLSGRFTAIDPQFSLPQRIGYARQPYIIDGSFSADGSAVRWTVRPEVNLYIAPLLVNAQRLLALGVYPRLRIALKGRMIASTAINGDMLYLDGQCFGKAVARADGSQRLDLVLPSGNGEKASDFESWAYVVPRPTISLSLDPTSISVILGSTGTVTGTVTLSYAALSDMQVAFSVSDNVAPVVRFNPPSVTIAKGATSQTVQIVMIGQTGFPSQISIVATLAGGNTASAVLNWTISVP